jgi:hypothetical protein
VSDATHDDRTRRILEGLAPRVRRIGRAVTARQVSRRLWRFRHAGDGLLDYMVRYGFGRWEEQRPGSKGGRPTRVFVFDDDGIDETVRVTSPRPR